MTQNLSIHNVIQTPLSYLLQNLTKDEILNIKDDNGWNIIHHTCMGHDFSKTQELLFHKFDFSNLSNNNHIPMKIMQKLCKNLQEHETFIHLSNGGYTGVHLLTFIISFLENRLNKNSNDVYTLEKYKLYNAYFNLLIEKNIELLKIKDTNNLSVMDYIILMESPSLINLATSADVKLESLSSVSLDTFKNILIIHKQKVKNIYHNFHINEIDKLIEKVIKIKTFNHINDTITINAHQSCTINKI